MILVLGLNIKVQSILKIILKITYKYFLFFSSEKKKIVTVSLNKDIQQHTMGHPRAQPNKNSLCFGHRACWMRLGFSK